MWNLLDIQFFVLLMVGSSIATHPFFRFPFDATRYQDSTQFFSSEGNNPQLRGYFYSRYPADGQTTGVQFLAGSNIFGLTSQDFHTRIGGEVPQQDLSYHYQPSSPFLFQRNSPAPQLPQFYHSPSSFGSQHYQYQQQFDPSRFVVSNVNPGNLFDPIVSFIQTRPQHTNFFHQVTEPDVMISTVKPEAQNVHVEEESVTETMKVEDVEENTTDKNVADKNIDPIDADVDKQDSIVISVGEKEIMEKPKNDDSVQKTASMKEDQPEN